MRWIILVSCIAAAFAGEIDNHLVGDPLVDCQDTMVSLTFTTEKPFTGRVYVKGLADDDRCSRNFATNQDQNKFSMMIQNGDCNMQRQRMSGGELEGLVFSLVIVVSFHGTFETKVDRAYRCMCFFRNIKRVTNFLDMSMIGTTELLDTVKMPTCTYTIRSGTPDGALLRYAKVGEKIWHVWECDDAQQGFLVHSCWVNDGRGNRFDLLDIDGCAIDPIIQPDVKYEDSLTKAYVETWGYKFSDTSVLDYMCVVELCKKAQGECQGLVPPSCGRGKRSVETVLLKANAPRQERERDSEMDVAANINVLDTLDADLGLAGPPSDLLASLNRQAFHPRAGFLPAAAPMDDQVCFSSPAFAIMIAVCLVLFITAVVAVSIMCFRTRQYKA